MFRGRLAPSPTGYLHLGNARSFLLAWLQMRSLGGEIVLRIEDVDLARAVENADRGIVRDLEWLGLDWDNALTPEFYQSNRFDLYREAVADLERRGKLYPCYCSRKELREAMSAPHGRSPRYAGICRDLSSDERAERAERKSPALRFRVEPDDLAELYDLVQGHVRENVFEETGDFIVARADGIPGYQLAVVLDDIAMGITHVLRGDDLLPSTPAQILLYRALGADHPAYAHVPLIYGPDGHRLAKRHGSVSIAELRESGVAPERVVGWLAWSCGLRPDDSPAMPRELVPGFSLDALGGEPTHLSSLAIF